MKVRVELITRQQQGDEQDETRLRAVGVLDDGGVLTYTEPEGAAVRVTAKERRVTVERTGEVCSRLVFVRGQRCDCRYETPYGALPMTAVCTAMEGALSGRLYVAYALEVGAGEPLRCTMEILTEEVSE